MSPPSDLEVQLEVERLVIQEYTLEQYHQTAAAPDILTVHAPVSTAGTDMRQSTAASGKKPRRKTKPR